MLFSGLVIISSILFASNRISKKYQKKPKKLVKIPKNNLSISNENNTNEETDINDIEEWVDRYFLASNVALGSALATIWIPALTIVSSITLFALTIPIFQRAYKGLIQQKRLKADIVDLIILPLLIISGYLIPAAIGYWLYYLGLKFLAKAKKNSTQKLAGIFTQQLKSVWVQRDDCEIEIDFETLKLGDIVVIQGGEVIPVDGIIIDGIASVDQRMMTGEAQAVEKSTNDSVFAFSIVLTGKIWVEVEKTGAETIASQIDKALANTNNFAGSVELKAEKMADKLTLPTLALSVLALPVAGYTSALVVLDSSLIDSIYITGTLSVLSHLSLASDYQLLIKDGRALEKLKQIDTIVFDKTGTLTEEQPHVGNIYTYQHYTSEEVLYYAAMAEYKQTHPIAKAILQAAKKYKLTLPTIDDTQYEIGYGVKICLDKQTILVGSDRFMKMENVGLANDIETIQSDSYQQGYSLLYVAINNQLIGIIELHPTIRPEVKEIIKKLKQRNLSIYILSGDHEKPTQMLAEKLGIEHYFAETFPEDKAKIIEQLQQQGKSVCFVGDGINDAIALKTADVSISLQGASTIATDTAQVILMEGNLNQLLKLFDLADSLKTNFRNSILWDVIPNVICIGGAFFFHLGIYGGLAIYSVSLIGGVINGISPLLKNDN